MKLLTIEQMIDEKLKEYIEQNILPVYKKFDKAHQTAHVQKVIAESLRLAQIYCLNENMMYTIAAYHDVGLVANRETHHTESARMLLFDERLREWFSENELKIMAEAAEDHRASSKHTPRSIYGKIVAEADRDIEPITVLRRTIQFGLEHYPQMSQNEHYKRFVEHLHEKYADGGYMKLWIPESDNAKGLNDLRNIICDKGRLKSIFDQLFQSEKTSAK